MTLYLNENRPLRLGTLCTLYAAQGIPDGFVQIALKNHLIHLGVTTNAVGNIVAMVSWPWSLKFLWGPVIDRYGYSPLGRRRPWILLAQVLMAITLLGMLFIPNISTNLRMLAFMVLLVNVFASLQDVSVDALAVDLLPAKERGLANGFMYGSNYAGSYFGGQMLGTYILQYGFSAAVKLQSVVLMCIAAVPLLLRERRGDALLPGQRGDPVLSIRFRGIGPTYLPKPGISALAPRVFAALHAACGRVGNTFVNYRQEPLHLLARPRAAPTWLEPRAVANSRRRLRRLVRIGRLSRGRCVGFVDRRQTDGHS